MNKFDLFVDRFLTEMPHIELNNGNYIDLRLEDFILNARESDNWQYIPQKDESLDIIHKFKNIDTNEVKEANFVSRQKMSEKDIKLWFALDCPDDPFESSEDLINKIKDEIQFKLEEALRDVEDKKEAIKNIYSNTVLLAVFARIYMSKDDLRDILSNI